MNMNDDVTITCYKKTSVMKRSDAIAFYKEGMANVDPSSSEYSRYEVIYNCLLLGKNKIVDTEELF